MKASLPQSENVRIGVLGLGYVGLPVAVAFAKQYRVTGFDTDTGRIEALKQGRDPSRELAVDELAAAAGNLLFTTEPADLQGCNVFIVAVPTPVDAHQRPDLGDVEAATRTVAGALKPGSIVIYEATVYPGCTEEICVPILEQESGLTCASDPATTGEDDRFFVGYSPERINPGDGTHSLKHVVRITAGCTPDAAEFVDRLYNEIVEAGTHRVGSIRVAEAAKVIENTQRDLNIALVNELALIFNRLGIDTLEVLEAAGTKWNFLPFRPGLVGGHCIGVDPYYLTSKAQQVGYHPEVILAGRRINDAMGEYVAHQVIRLLSKTGKPLLNARCLVLGLAFKEDCADVRNTRVVDIVRELEGFGIDVDVHDPWVAPETAVHETGLATVETPQSANYDALVVAVAHRQYREAGIEKIRSWGKQDAVIYDVKGAFDPELVDGRL